jgi:hypothetical protein
LNGVAPEIEIEDAKVVYFEFAANSMVSDPLDLEFKLYGGEVGTSVETTYRLASLDLDFIKPGTENDEKPIEIAEERELSV